MKFRSMLLFVPLQISLVLTVGAAIPEGYYATVDTSDATVLRATLHDAIDGHTRISYDSSPASFAALEDADADPNDPSRILDFYANRSLVEADGGTGDYNREHTWPRSRGFPDNSGLGALPVSDLHALFLALSNYNSSRGQEFYDNCNSGCSELVTELTNGVGGGSGVYPGNSNWSDTDSWEVWNGRRGDAARALFYMDVRYEGGVDEPDLILTDSIALIDSTTTGSNEPIAYMGLLSVLRTWNGQDAVDDKEVSRMEVIANVQDNRNPFVDFPEFAECLFSGDCSSVAPIRPNHMNLAAGADTVTVTWDPRIESDLTGYTVYRSTTSGVGYTALNGSLLNTTTYQDNTVVDGETYFYVVTASDSDGNESLPSVEKHVTIGVNSGVLIASESFETNDGYTVTGTTGVFTSESDYFGIFTNLDKPSGLQVSTTGIDGAHFIAGEDTNGETLPSDGIHTVTIDPVDISGYEDLSVTIALNAANSGNYDTASLSNGDYLRVFVSIDGGSDQLIGQFTRVGDPAASNGPFGQDVNLNGLGDEEISDYTKLQDYSFEISGTGGSITVKVVTRFESGNEEIVYDFVRLTGVATSSGLDIDTWTLY